MIVPRGFGKLAFWCLVLAGLRFTILFIFVSCGFLIWIYFDFRWGLVDIRFVTEVCNCWVWGLLVWNLDLLFSGCCGIVFWVFRDFLSFGIL